MVRWCTALWMTESLVHFGHGWRSSLCHMVWVWTFDILYNYVCFIWGVFGMEASMTGVFC
jgi:hypothetical protein